MLLLLISICIMFLLKPSFLCLWLLCSVNNSLAQQSHTHIVKVSSLVPPTACNRSFPKVLSGKASLEVVRKDSPCSHLNQGKGKTSFSQVLLQDRNRAILIQSKLKQKKSVAVPTKSGVLLGAANYFATVGIGTPKQYVSLTLDTGSDITWTQCSQCLPCYNQVEPLFQPAKSYSYTSIPCATSLCNLVSISGHWQGCVAQKSCLYNINYQDNSSSIGFLAKEKLTLPSPDAKTTSTISNYTFGCGIQNTDVVGGMAGIMGLDRSPLSIISQTSHLYEQYFSLCLPGVFSSSTGHITFGKPDSYTNKFVKFTPITTTPEQSINYDIEITGLSVAGQKLSIPSSVFTKAGAIIDSGTVLTRLPPVAYLSLRSAISQKMTKYKKIKSDDPLDLCYDFSENDTVVVPKVSISFKGSVELELDASEIFLPNDTDTPNQVCLAFSPNNNENDGAILGNYQYQGMEIHYDVAGGRIGFGARVC